MLRPCFHIIALFILLLAALEGGTAQPAKPRVDPFGDPLPDGALARIGTTRYRHGGMDLLGFTPDGKSLIFHGSGALRLMDVASGKQNKPVSLGETETRLGRRYDFDMSTTVLSGDTKVLAFVSMNGPIAITVAETDTGKQRKTFRAQDLFKNNQGFYQAGLALSHDGKYLLVFPGRNGDRTPMAWVDTVTGQKVHEIATEKDAQIAFAQFSPDGKKVVALESNNGNGKGNSRLRLFDVILGGEIANFEAPANSRFFFELLPDGKRLIASNQQQGGPVRLYDYSGKELKQVRTFSDMSQFGSFMLSRDGKQVFIASRRKIFQWDVDAGKEIRQYEAPGMMNEELPFGPSGRMRSHILALSPDAKQMAFAGPNAVTVFDTQTGKHKAGGGAGAGIGVLRFTPDDKGLIVGDTDHGVQQWDAATVKKGTTFARFEKSGSGRPRGFDMLFSFAGTASYSHDGKLLAVSLAEGGVGVWDAASGKAKKIYGPEADDKNNERFGPDALPYAFAFAPRGNMLAVSTTAGAIKLWDAATGKEIRSWKWHNAPARIDRPSETAMLSLAFSPDGKTLAGSGIYNAMEGIPQSTLILWEAATGKERIRIRTPIKGGNDDLGFELETIFQVFDAMAMALTFSPDGKHLMVGTLTGLHVIDALNGKDVVSFSGRQMVGRTATFSRDGKLLFVGRNDGMLRILDSASGRVVRDVSGHSEPIFTLALSADGKTLASGSNDSTVLLWDVAEISKPQAGDKGKISAKDLEQLWTDLASPDAAKAYQAINALAAAATESVPFLKTKLKPITPADPKVLEKLLEDLDSSKYAIREKATVELEKLGELARASLEDKVKTNPPLEMKQRIEKLVAKLNGPIESPQTLQALRAIEALERIGTPEAMAVLTGIANGASGHTITRDARDSVERLERQNKKK